MRFRKCVKLCKGIRLNFSGSGVSMNLGIRGASVSVGNKGTYFNYGIPGTGLYDRIKIADVKPTKKNTCTKSSYDNISNSPETHYSYNIFIDEKGRTTLEVLDKQGNLITKILLSLKYVALKNIKTN